MLRFLGSGAVNSLLCRGGLQKRIIYSPLSFRFSNQIFSNNKPCNFFNYNYNNVGLVNHSRCISSSSTKTNTKNVNKSKPNNSLKQLSIEEIYQKKTPIEHIILRPDSYIGSIVKTTEETWILDKKSNKMVLEECTYVPGLYKIFDEILVNAADNKQRDKNMNRLEVNVDVTTNTISVFNNGKGIPVQIHEKEHVYVPELVLGELLTGSNFDDNQAKVTGGRNGYGAKLTNIFSNSFIVETLDSERGLLYTQEWKQNMSVRGDPVITKLSGKPSQHSDYVKITFQPDLEKFNMKSLKQTDIAKIMEKRVYDIAACNLGVNVTFNGVELPKNFKTYVNLYSSKKAAASQDSESEEIVSYKESRWEIAVGLSESGQLRQVSFVNSIYTRKGGSHVQYITDQIVDFLLSSIKRQNPNLNIKPVHVKNSLFLFVNCLIKNPSFDSQTKDTLTTKSESFGSTCVLPTRFLKQVEKQTKIVETVIQFAKAKQTMELQTSSKKTKLSGISKLDDANWAGGEKSMQCTLIITEGDSAKSLAVSGLSVVGRDKYGVFPLKGKLLNVRDASHNDLVKNEELNNLRAILGLVVGKDYSKPEERKKLRYGKVMLMTDQDHDGSHIKGLFINFVHYFWPSLLQSDNFLEEFITPILKATKKSGENPQVISFFTIHEYLEWKKTNDLSQWSVKYYKGLGTNTSAEAKVYFSDLKKHRIKFKWEDTANGLLEMAFSKHRTDDRKKWIAISNSEDFVDHSKGFMSYSEFVNKELILFSRAFTLRMIPCVVDGLKVGQRKILYACFKRNLNSEMKVAQLSGYVSEHTNYHHGEVNLHGTIVNMAQTFVGQNNIPLLYPGGQFGTRLEGGKDAASARYIFTRLSNITRHIFIEDDDRVLNYLEEDGDLVEPQYYVPIIPMILVNGCDGLGVGWSTTIPMYDPIEIIDNLLLKIGGKKMQEMKPWFKGFKGTIELEDEFKKSFSSTGVIQKRANGFDITELPVRVWTSDYKASLEKKNKDAGAGKWVIREKHSDDTVCFQIDLSGAQMKEMENLKPENLITEFKLKKVDHIKMNLFDASGVIKQYGSPLEIIEDFYPVRVQMYESRKSSLVSSLGHEVDILNNKEKFCKEVVSGKLKIFGRRKEDLFVDLENSGYTKDSESGGFGYLTNISVSDMTEEQIESLSKTASKRRKDLQSLIKTDVTQLWKDELLALKDILTNNKLKP